MDIATTFAKQGETTESKKKKGKNVNVLMRCEEGYRASSMVLCNKDVQTGQRMRVTLRVQRKFVQ